MPYFLIYVLISCAKLVKSFTYITKKLTISFIDLKRQARIMHQFN